ncbi:MAG: AsmA-like C-terminal region-containing protein, partial [Opitutaceae bacterium]
PLAIGRWFGPWWPDFFGQLEFPDDPPTANVDVQGVWRQGQRAAVFVAAQAGRTLLRGAPVAEVRTRLFIRPGWVDGLGFRLVEPSGEAGGTFTHVAEPGVGWRHLDLDLNSTLGLEALRGLLGAPLNSLLDPYAVEASPELGLRGRLHGPAAPADAVNRLELAGQGAGTVRFHGFPLQEVAFKARVAGPEVNVDPFSARYAEGRVTGNARVWGSGAARRVGFNASLEEASLGPAATTLQTFLAARRGEPSAPPERFVQERANLRLNLSASAEGAYADPFSFRGDGNATLQGPALGEVPLLGLLSELFTFTSLRFTEARANLRLEGPRLIFPRVEFRGANSAIDAAGEFALDRRELRFNAKVFPFQESGNVLKSVVGAVLTPLSNALEVRLTGTLEKPRWEFVMGPRNFLRSLAGENGSAPPAPPAAPPAAVTPPAP